MSKITFKKLTYQGFRGQNRDITFSDTVTTITARNGMGKSTVFNAFLFLLTGYDAEDRNNFNIFNDKETFTPDNIGHVEVTGVFDVDGEPLKLSRRAKQTWTQNDEDKFTRSNDTYEYYVDDLTVTATKYKTTVEDIFGKTSFLKYMLNISYYRQNDDWKALRKVLAAMAGDITMQDMKGDYSLIADALKKNDAEALRKSYNNRLRDLNKEKEKKEAEIKAYNDTKPSLADIESAETEIDKLKDERKQIEERQKALVGQNDSYVAKRKQEEDAISAKLREMDDERRKHEQSEQAKVTDCERKLQEARDNNRSVTSRRKTTQMEIDNMKQIAESIATQLENLRDENKRINARQFENVCPECGQPYIGEKLEDKIKAFNIKKQADRDANINRGKAKKAELEDLQKKIAEAEVTLSELKTIKTEDLEQAILDARRSVVPFDDSEYVREINAMEAAKTAIPDIPEAQHLQERMGEINTQIEKVLSEAPKRSDLERVEAKIKQITTEVEMINRDIVSNMQLKAKVEAYQREYAEIIKTRVNVNFDKVTVVMTQTNKSGGIEDCCKLMLDGVTDTNNTASKVIIGTELAQAFQNHFDKCMPLFIDNVESLDDENIPKHPQRVLLVRADSEFVVEDLKQVYDDLQAYLNGDVDKTSAEYYDNLKRSKTIAAILGLR